MSKLISLRLTDELFEVIEKDRGNKSRTRFILDLLAVDLQGESIDKIQKNTQEILFLREQLGKITDLLANQQRLTAHLQQKLPFRGSILSKLKFW